MKKNRLLIDGVEVFDVDGLQEVETEIKRDTDSATAILSNLTELTCKGDAFDIIESKLFSTYCDILTEIKITFIPKCCDVELDYFVNLQAVGEYCPSNCTVSITPFSRTEEKSNLDCLKRSFFWHGVNGEDDPGFTDLDRPSVCYCVRNSPLQELLLVFAISLNVATMGALSTFVSGIRNCNRSHPCSYIKQILEYNCQKCGITLQSDLFTTDPHRRDCAIFASSRDGSNSFERWIDENGPAMTIVDLLDILKVGYNMDYEVRGNTLIVEQEEWFNDPANGLNLLIDLTDTENINKVAEEHPCFSPVLLDRCSFGVYTYQEDGDSEGNSQLARHYRDFVEFNPTGNDALKGKCEIIWNGVGPSRFVGDKDSNGNTGTILPAGINNRPQGHLLLARPYFGNIKLINLNTDTATSGSCATPSNVIIAGESNYNWPLYFKNDFQEPELIQELHTDDFPTNVSKCMELESFTFRFNCDQVNLVINNGLNVFLVSPFGSGRPEEININWQEQTITTKSVLFE